MSRPARSESIRGSDRAGFFRFGKESRRSIACSHLPNYDFDRGSVRLVQLPSLSLDITGSG